jgi:hypothetical protein
MVQCNFWRRSRAKTRRRYRLALDEVRPSGRSLRGVEPLPDVEAVDAKRRIVEIIQEFLDEGRGDDSLRPDVAAMDVVVFATMMATPLPHGPDWPTTSRRLISVFVRGIRTFDASASQ